MSGEFEKTVRHGIAASRWLIAPMYLGLALMLIVLLVQFVRDFFNTLPKVFQMGAIDALGPILSLGLVLIAAHSILLLLQTGYQIFGSGFSMDAEPDDGKGRLDLTSLRNRMLGISIVYALVLLLRQLITQTGNAVTGNIQDVFPVASVLGLLLVSALVLAVADWFMSLARRGQNTS